MESVEFRAKIKHGVIQIPAKYKGKFKDDVRVIRVAEDTDAKSDNLIERLVQDPLKAKGYRPLTREEAHPRKWAPL